MHNKSNPHQDTRRLVVDARKQITRSAIFAVSALVVIVIACYAWFVSNKTVTGILGQVLLSNSMFELASEGNGYGAFHTDLPEEYQGLEGDPLGGNTNIESTGSKTVVYWRLTDKSNLGNFSDSTGISPGSEGTLNFLVIPKNDGDLKLKFRVDLIPLISQTDNETEESIEEKKETLGRLLKGHFLFYHRNGTGEKNWVPCDSGEFVVDFGRSRKDDQIPVSLNWKWPLLLQHISNETGIKNQIPTNARFFFYPEDQIPENIADSLDTPQMSNLFNNADQYIGTNLAYVVVRLTAQLVS